MLDMANMGTQGWRMQEAWRGSRKTNAIVVDKKTFEGGVFASLTH